MSPVATETPTPGWGRGPTPAYTVIYTGKLHHDRGRYRHHLASPSAHRSLPRRSTCLRGFDGGNVRPARASRWTGPAGTGGLSSEPERLVGNGSPWFGERRPRTDRSRSTPGDTHIGVIMLLHLRQADTRAIAGWPQRIIMKATPPANVRDRVGTACENKTRAAQRHAPRHISVSTAYRRTKWCPEEDSNLHYLAIART